MVENENYVPCMFFCNTLKYTVLISLNSLDFQYSKRISEKKA